MKCETNRLQRRLVIPSDELGLNENRKKQNVPWTIVSLGFVTVLLNCVVLLFFAFVVFVVYLVVYNDNLTINQMVVGKHLFVVREKTTNIFD